MAPLNLPHLARRPAEGFYTSEVSTPRAWPLRTFLPLGYEPNYPYPLIVFLHGDGSSEEQILRLAPRLSRRNYICIAPRGPHVLAGSAGGEGKISYSWGPDDQDDPLVEEYVFRAIEQTRRTLHVHSERIYLAGFREGASLAYRLAMLYPERFGGMIAMNGCMPRHNPPRLQLPEARKLRMLIGHGVANAIVPLGMAKQDYRLFYTAGLPVDFRTYSTTHKIHSGMLRDIDRWVQDHISSEEGITES